MTAPQDDAAARAMLGAEYRALVGYDPFEDDPSNTVEGVRAMLQEVRAEATRAAKGALIETAGNRFAEILKDWLTEAEWEEMRRRNAAETEHGVCHSHDFCDANMAMAEALQESGVIVIGDGVIDDDGVTIWNAAWDHATRHRLTAAKAAP